jgi:hypothetical protein
MISHGDIDMPASDNGYTQKLPRYSNQPTIDRTMGVKNIRLDTFDYPCQRKQSWQTKGTPHGQGKIIKVQMAELTALLPKRTIGTTNNGSSVPAFQQ